MWGWCSSSVDGEVVGLLGVEWEGVGGGGVCGSGGVEVDVCGCVWCVWCWWLLWLFVFVGVLVCLFLGGGGLLVVVIMVLSRLLSRKVDEGSVFMFVVLVSMIFWLYMG